MAANQVVKTTFRGADRLSPVLKRIGIRVDTTGRKIDKTFKQATKSASIFGGVLKGNLVAGAIQRGAAAANMAIRGLAQEFIDFDKNLTKAVVRLPGQLDRTSEAFEKLGKVARIEARRTEFTAGEAAAGVEQLALAGFDLEKVMRTLPGVLDLATNADVGVAEATNMAVKTMGAFSLKGGDAVETAKQLTRVNNVFSKSISSASINMTNLFEVIKFGGPAADAAGIKLEEFTAVAQILADASIDASVAGTSMRSMFTRLAKLSPEATKELQKMGVAVKNGRIEYKNFAEVVGKIEKATAKMGKQQRLGALKVIFGKTAVNAASKVIDAGRKGVEKYTGSLKGLTDESAVMAKSIRDSVEGRIKRLKSALTDVGIRFIKAFNTDGGKSVEKLIESINRFDVKPVVREIGRLIDMMRDLVKWVDEHRFAIKLAIGAWIGYKVKLKAILALEAVAFFKDIAVALHGGAEGATAAAKGLTMLKTVGKGLLAAITSVTAVFAALGAVVFIVATDFENVTLGIAEGMARAERAIIKMVISAINHFKKLLKFAMPLFEILGLGDFVKTTGFETLNSFIDESTKRVKALDVAIKDMEIASLSENLQAQGLGVVGDQNVRGLGLSRVNQPPSLNQRRFAAAQFNPILRQQTQPSAPTPAPRAPNRSEVQSKATVDVNFHNAPDRTTAKVKSQSPTLSVSQEGLGSNG